jgi:hypothetical protein
MSEVDLVVLAKLKRISVSLAASWCQARGVRVQAAAFLLANSKSPLRYYQ